MEIKIEIIQRLHNLLDTFSPHDRITIISNEFSKAEKWQTFYLGEFVEYIVSGKEIMGDNKNQ